MLAAAGWQVAGAEEEQSSAENGFNKTNWLAERAQDDPRPFADALLFDGWPRVSFFERKNRLWLEDGFAFGGYASVNAQSGSNGGSAHAISESLFLATWEPLRTGNKAGRLVVGIAHDQTFGHPTTREFADDQGVVETPNDLDTDPDMTFTTLGLLHWEQETATGPGRGWGWRAGQLYGPAYFGAARYLDDDRAYFMARPLAAAAGAQWVGANDIGLGAMAMTWRDPFYVSVAVMDGKANREYPDFSSFADGQFLYVVEAGFRTDSGGPNATTVRLTASHLDVHDGQEPDKGPGGSVMVSAMKRFEGRWALAGRWSSSYRRLSADYRELLSLGALWLAPFGKSHDLVGFGVFAGDPSDPARGRESGFEIMYKLQLSQAINLTPDVQYWKRSDGGSDVGVWIAGLRFNFEF